MENPFTIKEDEGFSEPRTPVSEPTRQPQATEARPALHSVDNLQNSSAALQFFNFYLIWLVSRFFSLFSLHLAKFFQKDRKKEIRSKKNLLKVAKANFCFEICTKALLKIELFMQLVNVFTKFYCKDDEKVKSISIFGKHFTKFSHTR